MIDSGVSDHFSSLVGFARSGRLHPALGAAQGPARLTSSTSEGSTTARTSKARSAGTRSCPPRCAKRTSSSSPATSPHHLRFSLRIFARAPRHRVAEPRCSPASSPTACSRRSTGAASSSSSPPSTRAPGLPILEAMTCGAPVASSNTSAMPELLGDLDATFDPVDPADIARCMRERVRDSGQAGRPAGALAPAGRPLHLGAGRAPDARGLRAGARDALREDGARRSP